ncbi:juvenile hormone acid methyltransferase-like protein [Leptotrombidium deliense]|uniref:Juvenile hormone acid methyltransferase-like protein n=1 Tax=Leptotrombidium deliense TaxID=299467 RepID=A0A443S2W9_9ACAR|nr:juvenile hormone acid methyltransferase-like protein [Leptotrombidium deliense]
MIPNPKQYNDCNELQRYEAAKLFSIITQVVGPSPKFGIVVDIGCGTGNVTLDFLQLVKCDQLIAFDKSEFMIEFATENNKSSEINYKVADIRDDFQKLKFDLNIVERADLVFSVYCFHWVVDKSKAFHNISQLLKPGGKCFLIFIYWSDLFAYQRQFVLNSKWSEYFENLDEKMSSLAPAYTAVLPDIDHTRKKWTQLLESFGFEKCKITVEEDVHFFKEFNVFMYDFQSVCPFIYYIPTAKRDEFMIDQFNYIRNIYNTGFKDEKDSYEFRYNYCVIQAEKCEH